MSAEEENNHRSGAACGLKRSLLFCVSQSPHKHSDSLLLIKLVFGESGAAFDSIASRSLVPLCVINATRDQRSAPTQSMQIWAGRIILTIMH